MDKIKRGIFFFTGPLLLVLTTIFEWVMGRFLSMMICGFFSVFWLSFGMLQLPTLNIAASYSTTGTDAAAGAASVGYNAAIALYLVALGGALFTFFIFTLKTNTVLALIIGLATVAIWILSGAYFHVSTGDYVMATNLQHVWFPFPLSVLCPFVFLFPSLRAFFTLPSYDNTVTDNLRTIQAGGWILFFVGLLGWYMTVVIMAGEMAFPVKLPCGDLSHFWPQPKSANADVEQGEKRD